MLGRPSNTDWSCKRRCSCRGSCTIERACSYGLHASFTHQVWRRMCKSCCPVNWWAKYKFSGYRRTKPKSDADRVKGLWWESSKCDQLVQATTEQPWLISVAVWSKLSKVNQGIAEQAYCCSKCKNKPIRSRWFIIRHCKQDHHQHGFIKE